MANEKAVLISIQPEWCELIAAGKKTVEVRKTKPKLDTPFKCYIYCTCPKKWFKFSSCGRASDESLWLANGKVEMCDGFKYWHDGGDYTNLNGKVIGEFICDKIFDICIEISSPDELPGYPFPCTGLTDKEILQYLGNGKTGYGWHISDLKIYNESKKLCDLFTIDRHAVKQCGHRERACNNPDLTNGAFLTGSYVCMKGEIDWCSECKRKSITRAPQSWCYVEELWRDG